MIATKCAICGTLDNAKEVYPADLVGEALDERAFSARRFYNQKIHFRMVKCQGCGLLRSDPIIDPEVYSQLYERSHLTYEGSIDNIAKTYGYYLKKIQSLVPSKQALLEIGCGNGFFLIEAKRQGYAQVYGVEPSTEAITKAPARIKSNIKQGLFVDGLFSSQSFDCICIFQTLDHLLDPNQVLTTAFTLLKPGGIFLAINHNSKSLSARILGEKSPIIDIEHTYLYDTKTIRLLFEENGFKVVRVFYPWSRHSFGYLFSLLPIKPLKLKQLIDKLISKAGLTDWPLFLPIGNLGIVAQKPKI
ncbi:MAG: class I SAM-dependent methyltransferase [Candidatus Vogelbacteria bacterium]|nr:class I SAM-dependent methyltransferase [Candidatus Vogelbacteria bacterium]